jgi:hypothetical protein
MLDRFERPIKIVCLAMALLLTWQLGSLILSGDPLAKLKIPSLPTLAKATNDPAKTTPKETIGTNVSIGTNGAGGTNVTSGTNLSKGTNVFKGTNVIAKSTNAPAAGETGLTNASSGPRHGSSPRPGMSPGMMAQGMGGGMPGGGMAGGMKKIELPPDVQARVDKIIDSEILGPIVRPMPMALLGIVEQEAYIRATNGQTGPVKIGGEMGGIKLLRIGVNRVLVEQDGEKKELTLFDGIGGESLMPKATNAPSTNAPSTNAPTRGASAPHATANNASTTPTLSSKEKETP